MINRRRFRTCALLVIGLFMAAPVSSLSALRKQSPAKTTPSPGIELEQVMKLGGWAIPGLKQVVAVSKKEPRTFNGIEVQRKTLKLSHEPLYELETYYRGDDGLLRISPSLWVVQSLFAYELNGRTFAYQVDLVRVNVDGGVRTYIGIMSTYYYYDNDGRGRFEKRERVGLETLLSIPDWVKN